MSMYAPLWGTQPFALRGRDTILRISDNWTESPEPATT